MKLQKASSESKLWSYIGYAFVIAVPVLIVALDFGASVLASSGCCE